MSDTGLERGLKNPPDEGGGLPEPGWCGGGTTRLVHSRNIKGTSVDVS